MMRLLFCLALALAGLVTAAPVRAQGYSPTGACPTHEWNAGYGTMTASSNCAQPGFGDISGTATVSQGGTGDTGTGWTSYTPTVTCSGGSVGAASASGRYKTLGKTVFVFVEVTITSVGTCSANFYVSVPTTNPVSAVVPLPGYDTSAGFIPVEVESSGIIVFAVSPAAHQYFTSGVYEAS